MVVVRVMEVVFEGDEGIRREGGRKGLDIRPLEVGRSIRGRWWAASDGDYCRVAQCLRW